MADIFPAEGLDVVLTTFPKGAPLPELFLGLFVSQTESTVPDASAVLAIEDGVTEAHGDGYARQMLGPLSWETIRRASAGRQTSHPPVVFPLVGDSGWGTVNGWFLADAKRGGRAVCYSNFEDLTAVPLLAYDRIEVTPTLRLVG
jgi:hypothetical protein